MKRLMSLAVALGIVLTGAPASAQNATPLRIRGTIDALSGSTLAVTSHSGEKFSVALAADATVTVIAPSKLSDIKPGAYIGTAAMPQPDGSIVALEVQVFPESMRGVGEGQRPYDLQPESTMTNATVGDVVGTTGRTLTLKWQGKETKLTVPPDVPIITYEPGTRAMLTPGAHVIVNGTKGADGALVATRIAVGKDGLTPPM
jgi:Domain of unknown function (DUF5666)